ncbi:DNA polymerase-4 [Formivibrio citricus]|uniref:DNA polymerase-4 n=1 Tax=Formivibrio citricus TaxID=83765 RepID=A0A1I4XGX8_9NEIS|nr:hypothetical protein [Formivibrio citricus]SFN25127.1 DNA polymerase-4 [Formivibrio citricus]
MSVQACGDRESYFPDEPLRSLYVDFNSYFASVEQQVERRLRGRPVGVVPMLAETTCCIAASYEAKRFGVKTGTTVWQARELCPDIVLIEARPHLYVDFHHRLVAAVDGCLPVKKVRSIDEMACSLMGGDREKETAIALALQVKQAVRRVGDSLRCSIGIASNDWLAKTASDMQKPDGLIVLESRDLPHALFRLGLRDLCGIGCNMEARLKAAGIVTVEHLCRARLEKMRQVWNGFPGERLHALLRGREVHEVETPGKRSISHSHVLPPHLRHAQGVEAVLHRLLQKAAVRLRHHGLVTAHLAVKVKFTTRDGMRRWVMERSFDPTDRTLDFTRMLSRWWFERPDWACRATPFAAAVWFSDLAERRLVTLDLFASESCDPRAALDSTVDWINAHYGKHTLYWGAAYLSREAAPARIAFNHIPDDEYVCEPEGG